LLDFTPTGETAMTEDRLPLNELLQKAGEGEQLYSAVVQARSHAIAIEFDLVKPTVGRTGAPRPAWKAAAGRIAEVANWVGYGARD
jgi:hypothetical protein